MASTRRAAPDLSGVVGCVFTHCSPPVHVRTLGRVAATSTSLNAAVQQHVQEAVLTVIPAALQQARAALAAARCAAEAAHRQRPGYYLPLPSHAIRAYGFEPAGQLPPKLSMRLRVRESSLVRQYSTAVAWLCRQVASPAALASAALAERLVRVPHPSPSMIRSLAAAGVRVSYAQLVAAARAQVPGCERWMRPCLEPSTVPLPPALLSNVLTGRLTLDASMAQQLQPQHFVDLLHLALNSAGPKSPGQQLTWASPGAPEAAAVAASLCATAVEMAKAAAPAAGAAGAAAPAAGGAAAAPAAARAPRQPARPLAAVQQLLLQRHEVLQLLQAAVARRHVRAVRALCQLPAVQQLLTGADAATLVTSLAQDGLAAKADRGVLLELCDCLPAAEQLPPGVLAEALTKLLQAPEFSEDDFIDTAELPCARDISAAAAAVLLHQGVRVGFDPTPHLVAVQQLGAADVAQAAFAALDWSPQAQGSNNNAASAVQLLVQHPAAADISCRALEELLLVALVQKDGGVFTELDLLAVQANVLTLENVGRLAVAAAQLDWQRALDEMPALEEIGDEDVLAALRAALCSGNVRMLHQLLHRMAEAGWDVGAVGMMPQLLATVAVPLRRPGLLSSVAALAITYGDSCTCLPAAVAALLCGSTQALSILQHHMHEREWQALLVLAVQLGDEAAVCMLCRAPRTKQRSARHQQWAQDIRGLAAHLGHAGISTALEQARERGALLLASEDITGLGLPQDPTAAEAAAAEARQRQQQQQQRRQERQDSHQAVFDAAASERCQELVAAALLCAGDTTAKWWAEGTTPACSKAASGCVEALLGVLRAGHGQLSQAQPGQLQAALQQLASTLGESDSDRASEVMTELLRAAVLAGSAAACSATCDMLALVAVKGEHASAPLLRVVLLAAQLLHSSGPWQQQQRLLVLRRVCGLYRARWQQARCVIGDEEPAEASASDWAGLRELLAALVQLRAEPALKVVVHELAAPLTALLNTSDKLLLLTLAVRDKHAVSARVVALLWRLRCEGLSANAAAQADMTAAQHHRLLLGAAAADAPGAGAALQVLLQRLAQPLPPVVLQKLLAVARDHTPLHDDMATALAVLCELASAQLSDGQIHAALKVGALRVSQEWL